MRAGDRYTGPMHLRVGPFIYRVEKVAGYVEFEGEDCLGLCDNDTQVLYVSQRCSTAQQIQVLCHEYMEAWIYNFGQGELDKEAWCDLFGLAMTQFVMDLMQTLREQGSSLWDQGGAGADATGEAGDADADDRTPRRAQAGPPRTGQASNTREPVSARRARRARVPIRELEPIGPASGAESGGGDPTDAAGEDGSRSEAVRSWKNQVLRKLAEGFAD